VIAKHPTTQILLLHLCLSGHVILWLFAPLSFLLPTDQEQFIEQLIAGGLNVGNGDADGMEPAMADEFFTPESTPYSTPLKQNIAADAATAPSSAQCPNQSSAVGQISRSPVIAVCAIGQTAVDASVGEGGRERETFITMVGEARKR